MVTGNSLHIHHGVAAHPSQTGIAYLRLAGRVHLARAAGVAGATLDKFPADLGELGELGL